MITILERPERVPGRNLGCDSLKVKERINSFLHRSSEVFMSDLALIVFFLAMHFIELESRVSFTCGSKFWGSTLIKMMFFMRGKVEINCGGYY